ncbi:MAG: hypothetical protein ACRYG8_23355 [Janthinobacterium lividum]
MDLAALSFSIDSSDTLKASQALDALRQTTQATTQASKDFQTQGDFLVTSMSDQGNGAARLSRQLGSIGDRFGDLIVQANKARQAFDGSAASFDAWDIAQNKVEALGRAYGTTARGLDSYLQTANQLQMSSTQAAASVQRLTMALENQSAAAASIRQTLSNNGVSLNDLQTDQIDTLLTRVKTAFQSQPDNAQRTRDLRSVLGTFDPDVLGTFTNPNYVPIQQNREKQIRAATDLDIARHSTKVQEAGLQVERNNTEYKDLRDNVGGGDTVKYGFGLLDSGWHGRGGPSPVSDQNIADLRTSADPNSAFARDGLKSQDGRQAFYKQAMGVSSSITQEMLDHPEKMTAEQRAAAQVVARPQFLPTELTNWTDYLQSGKFSDNQREIDVRGAQDRNAGVGAFQRWWDADDRNGRNLFGTYTRTMKADPDPTPLDQEGTGAALAAFGDNKVQRYQTAQNSLKELGNYQGVTGGDTIEAAHKRGDAALATFTGAYGKEDGTQNFKAAQARAAAAARTALTDSGAVEEANTSLGLSSMSLADSAKAKSFIDYARQRGVPASDMAGQSLADLMDPAKSAGGNLPAGLLDTFNKARDVNLKANTNEFDRANDTQMSNLRQQDGIASTGSANLQDLTTYQDAYNEALLAGADATEAQRRGNLELSKVEEERSIRLKTTISDLEEQNKAAQKYNDIMSDPALRVAGVDRTSAGMSADIQTQADQMRRANPGSFDSDKEAQFVSAKQNELGLAAAKSATDKTAATEEELRTQQRLLDVSGSRAGIQDKMNRDVQVELSFEKEMAQAKASGDAARVAQIQEAVDRMKRLKDAVAEVNLEAKAFKLGADADRAVQTSRERMALPASERGRYDFQAPVRDLQQSSQYAPGVASGGGAAIGTDDLSPTKRAFLQTVAGPESRGGDYNLRYTMDGGAHFDSLAQHPRIAEPIKGSDKTSTAAGAYQITGETWTGLQKQYGYSDFQPATQDHAAWNLAADNYKRTSKGGDLEADLQDPSKQAGVAAALHSTWPTMNPDTFGAKFNGNMHGQPGSTSLPNEAQSRTAMGVAADKRDSEYGQQGDAARQEISEQDARRTRGFKEALPFVAKGDQVGAQRVQAGQVNDADPRGLDVAQAEAKSKLLQQDQDYARQLAATTAATRITIDSNKEMAVAYGTSTQAVQQLQDKLKVEAEARTTKMSDLEKENRLIQLNAQRMSEQTSAVEQQAKSIRESSADQKSINDLGPMASETAIQHRQMELDIARNERDNPGQSDQAKSDFRSAKTEEQSVRDTTTAINDYKSAWQSAQSAGFSTLNDVILNGGKAQNVVSSLAKSLAQIGLNTLEKSAGNSITDFLGGALKIGSMFSGGGAAAAASGPAFDAASAVFAHATGGVFEGGKRMNRFAVGGLIDRPTHFFSAGGETNLAGEMGTEAIMPLKRMPNGDLGVSTGSPGSGGGAGVTVHAPITITGNGGGGSSSGGMDPKQMAQLQVQLKEAVRLAVVAGIADEKRAGGSLY